MKTKFNYLYNINDKIIADFISTELTQTIVVILLNLNQTKVEKILFYFSKEKQEEITKKMQKIEQIHIPSIKKIDIFLKKKLSNINKNYTSISCC